MPYYVWISRLLQSKQISYQDEFNAPGICNPISESSTPQNAFIMGRHQDCCSRRWNNATLYRNMAAGILPSRNLTLFIWGVRWSAWVWPGQKTMVPTGFEPPQLNGSQKESLKFRKILFL
jgi:hypothetical protein